jgi:S1-C subfamily serine protease
LLHEPLARRRELRAEIVERLHVSEVVFFAGVVGAGTALYAAALSQGRIQLNAALNPGNSGSAIRAA